MSVGPGPRLGEDAGGVASAAGCPACGSAVFGDERFCESCGAPLPTSGPDAARPGTEDLARLELVHPGVAAVSDRGRRRARNEDAVTVAAGPGGPDTAVAVVCDGVGSTVDAHLAARAASSAAVAVLESAVAAGPTDDDVLSAACGDACRAAREAVAALPFDLHDHRGLPPSTTLVAAVVVPGRVLVASVGDSRAYWLPDGAAPRALTVDDSLAEEQIAEGVDTDVAWSGPDAHAITRWIGADAESVEPTVTRLEVDGPGQLLVCTDGLWNYFPSPDDLAGLAAGAPDPTPLGVARTLVAGALAGGGADNITVAVLDARPAAGPEVAPPDEPDVPDAPDGPTGEGRR